MEQIDLQNWEQFEEQLRQLDAVRSAESQKSGLRCSPLLYRGHREESWSLETTLERRGLKGLSLANYFRLVSTARPAIETFTETSWELDDFPNLRDWTKEYDNLQLTQFPGYDYLSYLRHHGFPSPLLDWTASPYVAAYFAFAEARPESNGRVAVFAYMEYAGHGKLGSSDSPQIVSFGPYVGSHPRHFLQQSRYTICAQYHDGEWHYAAHEDVFSTGQDSQDRLWKITLPASERNMVLGRLDAHNLNAFSLFRTEEALLEMISTREIELSDRY